MKLIKRLLLITAIIVVSGVIFLEIQSPGTLELLCSPILNQMIDKKYKCEDRDFFYESIHNTDIGQDTLICVSFHMSFNGNIHMYVCNDSILFAQTTKGTAEKQRGKLQLKVRDAYYNYRTFTDTNRIKATSLLNELLSVDIEKLKCTSEWGAVYLDGSRFIVETLINNKSNRFTYFTSEYHDDRYNKIQEIFCRETIAHDIIPDSLLAQYRVYGADQYIKTDAQE